MLRLRDTIDRAPRTKNGQPAQRTTGVARTQLNPVRRLRTDDRVEVRNVAGHFERRHGNRQRHGDPEPPRHVDEFRIRPGLGGRRLGLERHAADRAASRPDLADFRVHRAGVDRSRGRARRRFGRRFADVALRLGEELLAAAGAAEMVRLARELGAVPGGRRVDAHAADRILGQFRRSRPWRGYDRARAVIAAVPGMAGFVIGGRHLALAVALLG